MCTALQRMYCCPRVWQFALALCTTEPKEETHFLPIPSLANLLRVRNRCFQENTPSDGELYGPTRFLEGTYLAIQSARNRDDLVLLATPLPSKPISALPATITFSVNFLWNRPGTVLKHPDSIETQESSGVVSIYCTLRSGPRKSEFAHEMAPTFRRTYPTRRCQHR